MSQKRTRKSRQAKSLPSILTIHRFPHIHLFPVILLQFQNSNHRHYLQRHIVAPDPIAIDLPHIARTNVQSQFIVALLCEDHDDAGHPDLDHFPGEEEVHLDAVVQPPQ